MHSNLKRHPLASSSEGKTSIYNFTKWPALTDDRTGLLVNFIVIKTSDLWLQYTGKALEKCWFFFWSRLHCPILCYTVGYHAITHHYDTQWENIEKEMKGRSVSLTTDLWTSSTMEPYFTVTAHYITDQWKLKAKVLHSHQLSGGVDGASVYFAWHWVAPTP